MKKVSFVLERLFTEKEIKDVREFHQLRLEQAAARQDKESAGAAALMLKYFNVGDGSQWIGMSYYEDEEKAAEAAQLFSKSDEYRIVKATFTSVVKGIWGGYQIVEEAAAK